MYVTQNSRGVTAIDTRDNSMITIPNIIGIPYGIAFNEANGKMYVTTKDDRGEGKVVIINGFNIEAAPISVGHDPKEIAYNPSNSKMYVVNGGDSTVSVIDSTDRVVETISVGFEPVAIAYSPFNNRMYVTNSGSDTVSVIDTRTTTTTQASLQEQIRNTVCPEDYIQHWDKIVFTVNSSELTQSLNLTINTELDIRIKDDPKMLQISNKKFWTFLARPTERETQFQLLM
jgi:YVTN family beta-propeller protein